jgi:preprotein translocase SecE subunit
MVQDEKKKDTKGAAEEAEPGRVASAVAYLPGKFAEAKAFLLDVRAELKRVTWPPQTEVYPTTIVVIVTTVIFGVVLYAVDIVFSRGLTLLLQFV